MKITAFQLAQRFIGTKEISGEMDNPQIVAMLKLDASWPEGDEVPWCAAFVNYIAWLLRLPRSKSLRARSWLQVGEPIIINELKVGFDIVILKRGKGNQPGPEVIKAPGHVGFYAGRSETIDYFIPHILGGNQSNSVTINEYSRDEILGCRRLYNADMC